MRLVSSATVRARPGSSHDNRCTTFEAGERRLPNVVSVAQPSGSLQLPAVSLRRSQAIFMAVAARATGTVYRRGMHRLKVVVITGVFIAAACAERGSSAPPAATTGSSPTTQPTVAASAETAASVAPTPLAS